MGRRRTTIPINATAFRQVFKDEREIDFSKIAEGFGVTRQAVNGWLVNGRIPPRALAEIIKVYDVKPDEVEMITDCEPVEIKTAKKKKIYSIEINFYEHE